MMTLAIDFSSVRRSVAVVDGAASPFPAVLAKSGETGGEGTQAFAMMESTLREAGVRREDVELLALGLGPGSYAGVRVALSIANGWQLARSVVKTSGVSSVACLAWTAHVAGHRGEIGLIIDAQRGEFYLGRYRLEAAGCSELAPLAIVSRDRILELLAQGGVILGPQAKSSFPQAQDLFPDAGVLGKLALRDGIPTGADQLEPIYLRPVAFAKAPPPRTDL
ncbi:MAG TPA: tRNA (adenosine(37)-N6)-threonylcarbamoyltransferase complex dimerization subunit type 1 TsaB [Verrucomicrobiales bacterium]|nr:tRNA (adenosine(37)-N6)-threonylcarbamoyltransferase complex dimerization subunit type 1 TsaB [Verrucomicrobiales bacterium]